MRKSFKYIKALALASLVIFSGCEEDDPVVAPHIQTINASIESDETRVTLAEQKDSRDLLATWQADDKLSVFLLGDKYFEIGNVSLKKIVSDGKGCTFSYNVPDEFTHPVDGYRLICYTSNNKPVLQNLDELTFTPASDFQLGGGGGGGGGRTTRAKKSSEQVLMVNASLSRVPLSKFRAPVMFDGWIQRPNEDVTFQHYFTYELLHVHNVSDKPISFSLMGFEGTLWYKTRGSICLDKGRFAINSDATKDPIEQSEAITIQPHSSDIIVSSYIPNGQKINNVKLIAKIDGKVVSSSNTKSSSANIQQGHAYHMYVSWDGKNLGFEEKINVDIDPASLEFEPVPVGQKKVLPITIHNNGREPLLVSDIRMQGTTGAFAVDEWSWRGTYLESGAKKQVRIAFKPNKEGNITDRLVVYTAAGVKTIELSGYGGYAETPHLKVEPAPTCEFGNVIVGNNTKQLFRITNDGTGSLNVYSITLESGNTGFTLAPWLWRGKTLDKGKYNTIDVVFTPSASGKFGDKLVIKSNGGDVTVNLNGTGVNPGNPVIAVTPSSLNLDFGDVTIGSDNRQTISITNSGTGDLYVSDIVLVGGSKNGFQKARWTWQGEPIAPGATQEVSVRFYPSEEGSFSDVLNIITNAGSKSIKLTGKGVKVGAPELKVAPNLLSFSDVVVGDKVSEYISITNSGSKPMTVSSIKLDNERVGFSVAAWNWQGTPVQPGVTKRIQIDFSPNKTGNVSTSLQIQSDGGNQTVMMSGTGLSADKPAIGLTPETVDFGEVNVGEVASRIIKVKNIGKANLLLSNVKLSKGTSFAFEWKWKGQTLTPGESADIVVTFNPSEVNDYSDWLSLSGKDADPALVVLNGKGVEKRLPKLELAPTTTLDFSEVNVGENRSMTFAVKNTGDGAMQVTSIKLTNGTCYSIEYDWEGQTIAPGSMKTVKVIFKPNQSGTIRDKLTVEAKDTDSKFLNLTGVGVEHGTPELTLSPSSVLSFGKVAVGSRKDLKVTVKNTGTGALVVTSASLASRTEFLIGASAWTNKVLAPGESGEIALGFKPTSAGDKSDVLTVATNAGTKTVKLTGSGTSTGAPAISISNSGLAFGSVAVGASKTATFTISNTGTAPLNVTSISVSLGSAQYSVDTNSATVEPGSSATVTVTFKPTSTGSKSGTIAIEAEGINKSMAVILSGTGSSAAAPILTLSPSSSTIGFGEVPVGTRKDFRLTVKNTGTANLVVTSATLASRTEFLIGSTAWSNKTLAPGESGEIALAFKPTSAGNKSDVLTIVTNAGNKTINLSGAGLSTGSPDISISPSSLSFGNVAVGAYKTATFTISNPGSAPLNVTSISIGTGTGQYSVNLNSTTVSAGSSKTVTVTFKPTSAGSKSGTVAIEAEGINRSLAVLLSGTGTSGTAPALSLTPSSSTFPFGEVNVGSRKDLTLTVKNTGTANLVVSSATLASRTEFLIGASAWSNRTLAPGESGDIALGFKPSSNGSKTDVLTIVTNAGNKTINLTGTGVSSGTPDISISPTSLSFGNVAVGSSKTATFTISNPGSAPLSVTSISIGTGTGQYTVNTSATTVPVGGSRTVAVTFKPTSAGSKSGTVAIEAEGINRSLAVLLSGTGTSSAAPILTLTPSSTTFPFGEVSVGTRSNKTLTVKNTGTADLVVSSATLASRTEFLIGSTAWSNKTLAPGESGDIALGFQPSSAGSKTDVLTIVTNAGTKTINLTGTGVATAAPVLTLSPSSTTFAFGSVNVGTRSNKTLTVKNTGTADLVVSSATLASRTEFLIGSTAWSNKTLAPGESGDIALGFQPSSAGSKTDVLTIVTNAGTKTINLTGTGVAVAAPVLTLSPSSTTFAFGSVNVGTRSNKTLTVKNTGTADLVVSSATLASRTEFLIGSSAWSNKALAPGESGDIALGFQPSSAGSKTDVLTIVTNAGTKTINLTGTGVAVAAPVLTLSPSSTTFAFGSVDVGTRSSKTLTVKNTGTADLVVTSATLANRTEFLIGSTAWSNKTLAPGESGDIALGFKPTSAGSKTDVLTIVTNAGTKTITLTGTGVAVAAPVLTLSPSSTTFAFGSVDVGTRSSKTLTVKNTGTADLVVTSATLANRTEFLIGSTAWSNKTLAPGESGDIALGFKPTSAGSKSDVLTIVTNAGTKTITLTGTGVATAAPAVSLSPSSKLEFGNVTVGTRYGLKVTVKNTGTANLVVSSATLSNRTDFLIGSSAWENKTLAPGESGEISVAFRPSSTGSKYSVLTVETNAGTKTLGLYGTGI